MYDDTLGYLREARAALLEERDGGHNSRELSETVTLIDSAILWRQEDLRLKEPKLNGMPAITHEAHGHYRKKCSNCERIYEQCRCPSENKQLIMGMCDTCRKSFELRGSVGINALEE